MSVTVENARAVDDYVSAVRAALRGLPGEEVDELTEGLAADLTEALAAPQDFPKTPVQMFGEPGLYAAELQTAAGITPRRGRSWTFTRGLSEAFETVRKDVRVQFGAALAGQVWWPPLRDFLRALRPSWWSFRALLVYWYISQLGSSSNNEPLGKRLGLPHNPPTWLAMLVLLVVSVELGRRRWPAIFGAAVVVLNFWLVVVVLMALPVSVYWSW